MKKIKLILLFFIVIFSMNFCTKNIDVITMQQFQSRILDQNTVVLDVRTEEEYFGPLGHIDGAILIPINELESRMVELKKFQDETIYVVCRSGNRSNLGKDLLIENNFKAVNVDGGMLAWKADSNAR
ncbi:MAG: rhodanese-like domain-containing protein [Candidatus Neomarinimicrobiota bacterium]|jgi:rhodanese-related sulfurtransferase